MPEIETTTTALHPLFGGKNPYPDELPPAPPWRRFTGDVAEEVEPPKLSQRDSRRAETFRGDARLEEAVQAALILRRPLLVTGIPGTGKSSLAYAVAQVLELGAVLRWNITSRSALRDGLYEYDALGRLNAAQFRENRSDIPPLEDFLNLGSLGTALLPRTKPRVLLIDELDKSDIDLPNDLLNLFEEGSFEIPELRRENRNEAVKIRTADGETAQPVPITKGVVRCQAFPFVVITSNGEREFSPAFLRRCVQYHFPDPQGEQLEAIVRSHLGELSPEEWSFVWGKFEEARRGGMVATDQLLNALFLVQGKRETPERWSEVCEIVLKQLERQGR
jgi:MoxR-like ATPase